MTFARWGIPTLFWATLVLAWGVWLLPDGIARWCGIAVAAFCWLFTLAFFRNPRRTPQGDDRCLIAPADGSRLLAKGRVLKPGRTLTVCQVDVFVERDSREHRCAVLLQTLMTMMGRNDGPKG